MSSSVGDSELTLEEQLRLSLNEQKQLNEVDRLKGAVKDHDEYGYGIKAKQQDEGVDDSKQKTQLYEKEMPQGTSKSIPRTQPLVYKPDDKLAQKKELEKERIMNGLNNLKAEIKFDLLKAVKHGNEKIIEELEAELLQVENNIRNESQSDFASEEAISLKKKLIEATTAAAQFESKREFAPLDVYEEEELELKDEINLEVDVPLNNFSLLLGRLRTFPYSGNELPVIFHPNIISHIAIARIKQKNFLLLEACSLSEKSAETISLDQCLTYFWRNYKNLDLDNQDIDVDKLYNFALDIARGLSYLHLKKIAYRDLSLKRVLINGSQAKLEHPVVVRPEEISKEANDFDIWKDIQLFGQFVLKSLKRLGAKTQKRKNPSTEEILKHLGDSIISQQPTPSRQTVFEGMSNVVSYLDRQLPSKCPKRITMDPVPDINDLRNHSKRRKEILNLEQIRLPPLPNPLPFYTLSQINYTFVTEVYEEYVVVISDVFNGQVYIKKQRGRAFLNYQYENYQDMEIEIPGSEEEKQSIANNLTEIETEKQNERETQFCIIQHPRILQTYAFIRERSDLDLIDGIVLEYAEPLRKYIERLGPISEEVLWRWAYQLANVMTYLHEKFSIMHRSIIPESLFVDTKGDLKLGNFSFSRIYDNSRMVFANTLQKNRAFMAPETFGQAVVSYSFPLDVWSYGMVLYFLTHRRLPYTPEEVATSVPFKKRLVEQGHRPPLSDFPNFHYLIQSCWATEPEKRLTFKQIQDYIASNHPAVFSINS